MKEKTKTSTDKIPFSIGTVEGKQIEELHKKTKALLNKQLKEGVYTEDNIYYVKKISFLPVKDELVIDKDQFEQIQTLCRLWDINLNSVHIKSHRKYLGPIIVLIKKFLLKVLSPIFTPVIRQQKTFNTAVINCLVRVLNKKF